MNDPVWLSQLHVLAYNLGNSLRTVALPRRLYRTILERVRQFAAISRRAASV